MATTSSILSGRLCSSQVTIRLRDEMQRSPASLLDAHDRLRQTFVTFLAGFQLSKESSIRVNRLGDSWQVVGVQAIDPAMSDAAVIRWSLRSPEKFAVVFDRHHAAIHAYATRRAGRDAADDVLSEVFLAAFSSRSSFDSNCGSARAWLYGIAGNIVRRSWRSAASQDRAMRSVAFKAEREAATQTSHHERQVDAADEWGVVRPLLDGLAEQDREALLLYAWEELTYPEIAEAMGIPVGTVRSRIHRARTSLRDALEQISVRENQR